MVSVLSWLHDVDSKLCSGGLLEAPLQSWGVEKVQYKILLTLHKPCCEHQVGQEAGFGTELMELPPLTALSVWTPKPIRGRSWVFHAWCFLWPQVFSLLLLLTGFCFHSPSEHTAVPMGLGAQLLWVRGEWPHQLAPCGFCTSLHISVCGTVLSTQWNKWLFMELVKLLPAGQRSAEHLWAELQVEQL